MKNPISNSEMQSSAIDIEIGRRLRQRRELARISQSDLGQAIGVTFQQLQKYEKGANRIGAGQLFLLAKALKFEPSYFFENLTPARTPHAAAVDAPAASELPEESQILLHNFSNIRGKRLRRTVLDLVAALGSEPS